MTDSAESENDLLFELNRRSFLANAYTGPRILVAESSLLKHENDLTQCHSKSYTVYDHIIIY
jgi:hypothetical protein